MIPLASPAPFARVPHRPCMGVHARKRGLGQRSRAGWLAMAQPEGHRQSGNRMLESLAELIGQGARTGVARVPYQLDRVGVLMRPEIGNDAEEGGVLNPGGARARDGSYLLFPRLVAAGNYSRIGIARVCYTSDGLPSGVERLGLA